jgi:radical SAM superfamily enzyme YgiQ (UPF0313 family)
MKEPNLRITEHGAPSQSVDGRMSVCLVTALTVADFIDPDLTTEAHAKTGAQIGVLTLAALLREQGINPIFFNLDDLFYDFIGRNEPGALLDITGSGISAGRTNSGLGPPEFFFPFVAGQLRSISCDIFGFSSICSSYPLTLRLAQEARQLNPNATIIIGGPQASVVDVATMVAFPCVDIIVRGEADETFPELLRLLGKDDLNWQSIPGITFRKGAEVIRNKNASVVADLDQLPLPAFDLDLRIKDRGGIHLEIGRGCPFACTFCSTNDFFRRNFRLKSPPKMIDEISVLKKEYGLNYFSLIHDMYTIDRKKVVAFCKAILDSGEKFTWGCSARTDCIDDDLIALMAQAGCTGIFFGIETGSARLQHVINKKLDLAEAVKRIECADRHGIQTTVALIVGFPEETRDDLRDTVRFFIDSLRFSHAEPQCTLLAPLAATPVYEQHKEHLIFDHIFSDMSHQSWRHDPVEVDLIKNYPEIFPNFYAIPTHWLERGYVKEVMDFVTYLATWFRWLPVGLLQDSGDLLRVFDRWHEWLGERSPRDSDEDTGWTPYYSHRRFRNDFLEFVQTCYLEEMATARAAIAALAQIEKAVPGMLSASEPEPRPIAGDFVGNSVPYQLEDLVVADLAVDYNELIESLRNRSELTCISAQEVTVVFSPKGKQVKVWQLAPLAAAILHLCDGRRTVGEIVAAFAQTETEVEGIPPEKVCLFGLRKLQRDGFIGFSSSPISRETQTDLAEAETSLMPPRSSNTQQPWPPFSAIE